MKSSTQTKKIVVAMVVLCALLAWTMYWNGQKDELWIPVVTLAFLSVYFAAYNKFIRPRVYKKWPALKYASSQYSDWAATPVSHKKIDWGWLASWTITAIILIAIYGKNIGVDSGIMGLCAEMYWVRAGRRSFFWYWPGEPKEEFLKDAGTSRSAGQTIQRPSYQEGTNYQEPPSDSPDSRAS